MAGLTAANYYSWMKRGREGDPHLAEFAEDIELALGFAEGQALAAVRAFEDPEHAKWYLERTRAAGYSKEVNQKVEALIADFMTRMRDGLPPALYLQVLAVANGDGLPEIEGPSRFRLRDATPEE